MTDKTLPPQFVPTQQVFNLRDIGGPNAAGGTYVKTGQVYRSDNFSNATASDIDYIVSELGIRHVIDLRRPEELDRIAAFPEIDGVTFHHFEFLHLRWENIDYDLNFDSPEADVVRFLFQRYTSMVESGYKAVCDTLNVIALGEPVIFHCMAGKDRTGIIAAILLDLLGVKEDNVAEDYSMTAIGQKRWQKFRDAQFGRPDIDGGLRPYPDAIRQTLAEIRARFGSISGYAKATGFNDQARLQEILLN